MTLGAVLVLGADSCDSAYFDPHSESRDAREERLAKEEQNGNGTQSDVHKNGDGARHTNVVNGATELNGVDIPQRKGSDVSGN